MYFTLIYKNLSQNQKLNIKKFIKDNFLHIHYDNLGLDDKTIIIINYENSKIIGCVCLLNNKYLKEILINACVNLNNYNFENENSLFLYNLCVDPEYRNKKIGTELIDLCLDLCKKINIDFIYCHPDNDISRNLFIKKGFFEDKNIVAKFI